MCGNKKGEFAVLEIEGLTVYVLPARIRFLLKRNLFVFVFATRLHLFDENVSHVVLAEDWF